MAKKLIDRVVEDMQDGLECPEEKIDNGKKHFILNGDFITMDIDPIKGDRAFVVNGEANQPSFYVEITQIDTHKIK